MQPAEQPETIFILVPRRHIRLLRRRGDLAEPPEPGKPKAPQPDPRPTPPVYPPQSPPPAPKKLPVLQSQRPRTRGDCLPGGWNEKRPCLFASCRHSLLVDIDCDTMEVRETAEDPRRLPATCSLDVADAVDGSDKTVILRDLEGYFGKTRERVRQIELRAIRAFGEGMSLSGLDIPVERVLRSPWGNAKAATRAKPDPDEDE